MHHFLLCNSRCVHVMESQNLSSVLKQYTSRRDRQDSDTLQPEHDLESNAGVVKRNRTEK